MPPATAYVAATLALLACVAFFCVRRRPLKAAAECCGCLLSVQVVPFRPLEEEDEAAAASSPPKRSPPKLKRLLSTGLILNEAARPIMTAPRTPRAHPAGLPARLHKRSIRLLDGAAIVVQAAARGRRQRVRYLRRRAAYGGGSPSLGGGVVGDPDAAAAALQSMTAKGSSFDIAAELGPPPGRTPTPPPAAAAADSADSYLDFLAPKPEAAAAPAAAVVPPIAAAAVLAAAAGRPLSIAAAPASERRAIDARSPGKARVACAQPEPRAPRRRPARTDGVVGEVTS